MEHSVASSPALRNLARYGASGCVLGTNPCDVVCQNKKAVQTLADESRKTVQTSVVSPSGCGGGGAGSSDSQKSAPKKVRWNNVVDWLSETSDSESVDEPWAHPHAFPPKAFREFDDVSNDDGNMMQPVSLWMRNLEDVTTDEYVSFYKIMTRDQDEYLAVKHFSDDGQLKLHALLFVPCCNPFDVIAFGRGRTNIKLYESGELVEEAYSALLPEWMHFVLGVVECKEQPLEISLDKLRMNKIMRVIRKVVVERCLEMFADISRRTGDRKRFDELFGWYLEHTKPGDHCSPRFVSEEEEESSEYDDSVEDD